MSNMNSKNGDDVKKSENSTANSSFNFNDLYVYDLSKSLLNSLQLLSFDLNFSTMRIEESLKDQDILPTLQEKKQQSIKEFESIDKQFKSVLNDTTNTNNNNNELIIDNSSESIDRSYYKSDLYRFNLKRKLKGLDPLNEKDFESLIDNLDESISSSDLSSGDDDDDDDGDNDKDGNDLYSNRQANDKLNTIFENSTTVQSTDNDGNENDEMNPISFLNTRSPFIYFNSKLLSSSKSFGLYKHIFNKQELENPISSLLSLNKSINDYSILFMIGGGHFAGAVISHKPKNVNLLNKSNDPLVFQSINIIEHKTFHRYTTRRKQGGSQSANDNAKGKANSAGSNLRRYNEAALETDIRELLLQWKNYINGAHSIYIRANGSRNKGILVGYDGCVIHNNDPRLKNFPFATKRATTKELKRSWAELTHLVILDTPQVDGKKQKKIQLQNEQLLASKQKQKQTTKEIKEINPSEKHTNEIITFIKKSRSPALIMYFKKHKLSPDFKLEPFEKFKVTPTPLHYAASLNASHIIQSLLVTIKSNPEIKNEFGKVPYDLIPQNDTNNSSEITKRSFQVSRHLLGEDKWDWKSTHIGSPLTKQESENLLKQEKLKKEAEKNEFIKNELEKIHLKENTKGKGKKAQNSSTNVITSIGQDINLSGLSDEAKMKLMREQRARAAEARFKKTQKGN